MFKKLDQYLLNNYPAVWVTRFHVFIPIGIAIFAIIYLMNAIIPWDPKDEFPRSEGAIVLTLIPVLIYLVYWFVFQSRYNVIKSRGKTSIFAEYFNFVIYLMLFFTASMIFSAVPLSNYHRVKNAVGANELIQDKDALNLGYNMVGNVGTFRVLENGNYQFSQEDFIYSYNYDYYEYEEAYSEPYYEKKLKTVDRKNILLIIKNFVTAYNKYSNYPIYNSPEDILANRVSYTEEDYYNEYYLDDQWDVQWKVTTIVDSYNGGFWFREFQDAWFWKVILGICAFLALLVIIFKQSQLRQFIFGFISICLTPLLFVIVGFIVFEIIQVDRGSEENVVAWLFILWYAVAGFLSIRGYLQKDRNNLGYIATIYFHFFIPGLPVALFFLFADKDYYYYRWYGEGFANLMYYSSWTFGLASIAIFKNMYTKYYHIPSAK